MSTPSEIKKLIERIDRELTLTEQETREGINLLRPLISRFPDNLRKRVICMNQLQKSMKSGEPN